MWLVSDLVIVIANVIGERLVIVIAKSLGENMGEASVAATRVDKIWFLGRCALNKSGKILKILSKLERLISRGVLRQL